MQTWSWQQKKTNEDPKNISNLSTQIQTVLLTHLKTAKHILTQHWKGSDRWRHWRQVFNESVVYCGAAHCCFLFSLSPTRHLRKVTMSKNVIYNYSNGSGVCEINFLSNRRPKLDLLYPPFCDHTEIHRWKKSFLALIGFIDGNI